MRNAVYALALSLTILSLARADTPDPATQPATQRTTRPVTAAKEVVAVLKIDKLGNLTDETIGQKEKDANALAGRPVDLKLRVVDAVRSADGTRWRYRGHEVVKFPDGIVRVVWDVSLPEDQEPPKSNATVRCQGQIAGVRFNKALPTGDAKKDLQSMQLTISITADAAKK